MWNENKPLSICAFAHMFSFRYVIFRLYITSTDNFGTIRFARNDTL